MGSTCCPPNTNKLFIKEKTGGAQLRLRSSLDKAYNLGVYFDSGSEVPAVKVREVLNKLHEDGWYELPGKSTSHIQLKHPSKPGKVTVAYHGGDIPPFTLKSIWKQAEL